MATFDALERALSTVGAQVTAVAPDAVDGAGHTWMTRENGSTGYIVGYTPCGSA